MRRASTLRQIRAVVLALAVCSLVMGVPGVAAAAPVDESASPAPSGSPVSSPPGVGFEDTCAATVVTLNAGDNPTVFTVDAPQVHEDIGVEAGGSAQRNYPPLGGSGRVVVTVGGSVLDEHDWVEPEDGCQGNPPQGRPQADVRVEGPCASTVTVVLRGNGAAGTVSGFVVTEPTGDTTRFDVASGEERVVVIPAGAPGAAITVANLRTGETARISADGGACTVVMGVRTVRKPPVVVRPRAGQAEQLPMTGPQGDVLALVAAGLIILGAGLLGTSRLLPQQTYRRRH